MARSPETKRGDGPAGRPADPPPRAGATGRPGPGGAPVRSRTAIPTADQPAVPRNVDEYLLAFPEDVRVVLRKIREVVREAAPQATEIISYRMPALRQHGVLVYYAAFRTHIGFYPPIKGDPALERAAAPYAGEKGNLRFPLREPIPYELIRKLTELRASQDRAAHEARVGRARR